MYPPINFNWVLHKNMGVFCTRVVLFALAKCNKKGDMCTRMCIMHNFRAKDNQNAGPSVRYALVQGGAVDGQVNKPRQMVNAGQ